MTILKSPSPSVPSLDSLNPNAWLDDGIAEANDVKIPLEEIAAYIDAARASLTINSSDTSFGDLSTKLIAAAGLSLNIYDIGAGDLVSKLNLDTKHSNLQAALLPNGKNPIPNLDATSFYKGELLSIGATGISSVSASAGLDVEDMLGTAGEGLPERALVYLNPSDNKWYRVDIDTNAISKRLGFVLQTGGIALNATGTIRTRGEITGFLGLTAGQPIYASPIAGDISQIRPNPSLGGSQVCLVQVAEAVSATTILMLKKSRLLYLKRASLAPTASLNLSHLSDPLPYLRRPFAYLSYTTNGLLRQYSSSNQDSFFGLQQTIVNGHSLDQCNGGTAIGTMATLAAAFDNTATTSAQRAATTGQIGYDFGLGVTKTIRRYTVQHSSSLAVNQAPKDWTLQYSSDNSVWNTADTRTAQTAWTASQVRTFDVAGSFTARYWRLNITANNGNTSTCVGEIEMLEMLPDTAHLRLAQTFTLNTASLVLGAELYLRKIGVPTGNLSLRIETLAAGLPTGNLAHPTASLTITESSLNTSLTMTAFTFSSIFILPAGQYALVLASDRPMSATDYVEWGTDASAPTFAGGTLFKNLGAGYLATGMVAIFNLIEPVTSFEELCRLGQWAGTGDILVRYDDGAGSNKSTQTTFKNNTAETIDLTIGLEL